MSSEFDNYDFEGDEGWRSLLRSLDFSALPDSQVQAAVVKRKKKYYKQSVNPDWEEPAPAAAAAPASDPSPRTSSSSSSSSSYSAASSSASPRSTSSSSSNRGGVMVSYVQLALHVSALLCALCYVLPVLGVNSQPLFYSRVFQMHMLFNAITLWRAHGRPRLEKMFWIRIVQDESAQLTLVAFILMMANPFFLAVVPFCGRSLLFACRAFAMILPKQVPALWKLLQNPVGFVTARSNEINASNASMEVFTGFMLIFMLLTPQRSFISVFAYWQFLRLRYHLNSDIQMAFTKIRMMLDSFLLSPRCPAMIGSIYTKILGAIHNFTDLEQQQQQQQTLASKCVIC